jgi:RNA polymerase sigma factor (sigma-70 family)
MASVPLVDLEPGTIAAAQAGDERAYAAIYAHYSARIFTLIYRLVPRRAQAEDLLQEVFIEVLRSVSTFTGAGSFGGWLRSIAVNKCLSHLRSPWRRTMLWLDETSIDEIESTHAAPPDASYIDRTELETAMSQLSPITRAVVWLHDVEGYTHAEIGQRLNRTASFSKSQLARAHARLRELLTTHDVTLTETSPCTPVTQSLSHSS